MTDTETGHADEAANAHASDDAHGGDGHGGEAVEPLGPIDTQAWGAAIIGGAIGVVLVLVMLVAIGGL